MKQVINHEKAFLSLFNQTACYHRRHQVFEDFISSGVIASDMDGTLLTSQHVISQKSWKSIQAAVERVIRFVIASGRSWEQVIDIS